MGQAAAAAVIPNLDGAIAERPVNVTAAVVGTQLAGLDGRRLRGDVRRSFDILVELVCEDDDAAAPPLNDVDPLDPRGARTPRRSCTCKLAKQTYTWGTR